MDIIQRCLEIQNVTYDENKLTISIPEKNSDTTTALQLSYGKERGSLSESRGNRSPVQ
ncbi:MAG: hypothetical protein V7L01_16275 [Nostoc sp.]|uniref:hypothetical protein n=1 Tax=Nostoc sp. TaxID=1180 RepID=UPI002FF828BC